MIPGAGEYSEEDLALGVSSCLSIHQRFLVFITTAQATNAFPRSVFVWSVITAMLNSHHKELKEREREKSVVERNKGEEEGRKGKTGCGSLVRFIDSSLPEF